MNDAKTRPLSTWLLATGLLLTGFGNALATVRYVDVNSTNATAPYSNWSIAAKTIQDAVDAAVAGDEIVVTNGLYAVGGRAVDAITNRVAVDKALSLRSVNGPQFTVIDGGASVRCVYLTNGASLSGFTLTHGRAEVGGGLRCRSANTVVSNCVVSGNSSFDSSLFVIGSPCCGDYIPGLGVALSDHPYAGGVYGGTLYNCTLSDNWVETSVFGPGTGAYCSLTCVLTGGIGASYGTYYRLGAGGGAANATLNNCILAGNRAVYGGGAYRCTLNNCTLTGNTAAYSRDGGQAYGIGGGAYDSALNNCIIYFNTAADAPDYDPSSAPNYCCTTPQATNGFGNITNAPLFVGTNGWSNLRLQSNSPCINAGRNAFAPAGLDLDGNPRIQGGTVDIGAYEFQNPASQISYAWLQQFGLPLDGSADFTDPDSDGLSNWQEWRCLTDPTNALSALRLLKPLTAGTNVMVTWQSAPGLNYFLERSVTLADPRAFTLLATNIPGQPGATTYTDTNAVGHGPLFYRVRVGE